MLVTFILGCLGGVSFLIRNLFKEHIISGYLPWNRSYAQFLPLLERSSLNRQKRKLVFMLLTQWLQSFSKEEKHTREKHSWQFPGMPLRRCWYTNLCDFILRLCIICYKRHLLAIVLISANNWETEWSLQLRFIHHRTHLCVLITYYRISGKVFLEPWDKWELCNWWELWWYLYLTKVNTILSLEGQYVNNEGVLRDANGKPTFH